LVQANKGINCGDSDHRRSLKKVYKAKKKNFPLNRRGGKQKTPRKGKIEDLTEQWSHCSGGRELKKEKGSFQCLEGKSKRKEGGPKRTGKERGVKVKRKEGRSLIGKNNHQNRRRKNEKDVGRRMGSGH